jgi:murein DD-endopeptidase MepM/ murein hydrolase activator NlpD
MRITMPQASQHENTLETQHDTHHERPARARLRHPFLVAGLATVALAASIPVSAVSASGSALHRELVRTAPQHLDVPKNAEAAVPTRASYEITQFTVVQLPVKRGTVISSPFGYRAAPCSTCSTFHEGLDYLATVGSKVPAIADGTVVEVGNPSGNRGVYVILRHSIDGVTWYSSYSHMQLGSMHLAVGNKVKRGHTVGRVGSTGQSTGAHLFFQILDADKHAVDPAPWLKKHVNI